MIEFKSQFLRVLFTKASLERSAQQRTRLNKTTTKSQTSLSDFNSDKLLNFSCSIFAKFNVLYFETWHTIAGTTNATEHNAAFKARVNQTVKRPLRLLLL